MIKEQKTAYVTLPPPIKGGEKLTTNLSVMGKRSVTNKKAKVVVMGKQGKDQIAAHDLGEWTGTFAYEIMTRMGKGLPIVYVQRSRR